MSADTPNPDVLKSPPEEKPADSAASDAAGRRPSGASSTRLGRLLTVGWMLLLALAIFVLRLTASEFDFAIVNVTTLILGFLIFCTLLAWFTWRAPLPRAVRFAPLIGLGVVVAVLAAVLEIERTSGELVPVFRFRWVPPPDETIGDAVAEVPSDAVDLKRVTADDFPQFLGPDRNAWIDGPALASDWQREPPRELWRRPIGAGWCSFAVVNGYAVTMEQRGDEELVSCYKVDSGELCWASGVPARHETVLGGVGPRSTPTIDEGRVYALGGTGIFRCLDGATGEVLWEVDILARYRSSPEQESRVLAWGRSNSPLIVGRLVVLPGGGPPGGDFTSLVAFDKVSGEVVWEAGDDQISYSSPIFGTLAGVPQIVSVNEDNLSGHLPENGETLWKEPWPGDSAANASVSQAHILPGDRVVISKGYGEGLALIDVRREGGDWQAEKRWWEKGLLKTKFAQICIIDNHAYGLSDGILECVDLEEHRRVWKNGRYGHGQILGVGKHLLVLSEEGDLALVEATPAEYREVARLPDALEGQTWNNFALYGNRLLIRNAQETACYELPTSR